jgi:hypothetical protein
MPRASDKAPCLVPISDERMQMAQDLEHFRPQPKVPTDLSSLICLVISVTSSHAQAWCQNMIRGA